MSLNSSKLRRCRFGPSTHFRSKNVRQNSCLSISVLLTLYRYTITPAMRLDTRFMRYLDADDWKVLHAVEQGSKNHEVVPTKLIAKLSRFSDAAVLRNISNLAKVGLIARQKNAKYEGYRLSYGGLDYLSLHTYQKRNAVFAVGNQIGVGKESDIFVVANSEGRQLVLKIHRLGRISFRTVKANRDYLKKGHGGSWMYMSQLAAVKEYTFMTALREAGFAVPEPISQTRHTIVMSLIDAFPMRQIASIPDPSKVYAELIAMLLRLAQHGLIHGDFNEFNILLEETRVPVFSDPPSTTKQPDNVTLKPILIDFPQMISIDHENAEFYFDRDVACIKRFFARRFHFVPTEKGPFFADAKKLVGTGGVSRLDVSVAASGFSRKMAKELETYMKEHGVDGDSMNGAEKQDGVESEDQEDDEESDDDDGSTIGEPSDIPVYDGHTPGQKYNFGNGEDMRQLAYSTYANET